VSSHPQEPLAFPVLVGDIGGTNVRFGVVHGAAEPLEILPLIATADFPDIETAIVEAVLPKAGARPRSALIAGAGPVHAEGIDLTNAHWLIRPRSVLAATGLADMALLNDFEAQALAVANLDDPAMTTVPIGPDLPTPPNCRVVMGSGTGLGVAGLVYVAGMWTPVPGEGGHVALGPAEQDEAAVWPHIEREGGRISAETLLCGRGITRLYRAVAAQAGASPAHATPAEVSRAALAGDDAVARETMRLFCRLLGRLAGDLALVFMATGGVFIGGGIAPRIAPLLQEGEFRRAFEAKWPHEALMRGIATRMITAAEPGLAGLAAYARRPDSYAVPLAGRRWMA